MPATSYHQRLAEILREQNLLSNDALTEALNATAQGSQRLEKYLVEQNLLTHVQLALVLSEYLRIPPVRLRAFSPDQSLIDKIGQDALAAHTLMPIVRTGNTLTLAMGDPFDLAAIDQVTAITGWDVAPLVAPENEVKAIIARLNAEASSSLDLHEMMQTDGDIELLEGQDDDDVPLDQMLESAEGAPVIRMVNLILIEAIRTGASDIHIEPAERKVRLRYRIDGELVERPGPPKSLQAAVVSRVKILSDLDIAERRLPQDGRFNIKALGREIDLRVSILPTVHGEKVVMRTLDKSNLSPSLAALGLDDVALKAMQYGITQPHGIILVTGPTGSGKTTTLYSCLQDLNQPDVNIITCEDPVEYQVQGINQVAINGDIGLTFAAALRSILRQDPDIVLVGEIRDGETAEIAVRAALTGHLVLSTLHTNDASGAVTRLIDMGVEPFMLGSCLVLTQAQRLYRKLCAYCKKPAPVTADILATNHIDPSTFEGATIYAPVGCPRCTAGFKGRGAIMEVLLLDARIREAILRRANKDEIQKLGIDNGMVTLKEAGLHRVREGITSLDGALSVTGGE